MRFPAVAEAIFITELHAYEAFDERGVAALVTSDDPVGMRCIRSLQKDARWSDDNMVTGYEPLREPERLEGGMLHANAREAVFRVFIWLTYLELYGKQT